MLDCAHVFDALKMLAVAGSVTAQHDHGASGIVAWTPDPIAIVPADRGRQPVASTVEVYGRGLAPAVAENRCARSLFRRQAVVDSRHLGDHLRPAELVSKPLR